MYFGAEFWEQMPRSMAALRRCAAKVIDMAHRYRDMELNRVAAVYDIPQHQLPGAYTAPIPLSEADTRDYRFIQIASSAFIFDRIVGNPVVTDGEITSKTYEAPDHIYQVRE